MLGDRPHQLPRPQLPDGDDSVPPAGQDQVAADGQRPHPAAGRAQLRNQCHR